MDFGTVKVMLVVGTLAVSVLGTELVAQKEAAPSPQDTASVAVMTLPADDGEKRLELPPVPRAISPIVRPVARSRSSR
jgi:hypothetical protein